MIPETSASLLERLQQPANHAAWRRFLELYAPVLYGWAKRAGLAEHDAADLVQDVLTTLLKKLPEFRYEPGRSFRAWLKTVLLNQWRNDLKKRRLVTGELFEEVAGPDHAIELEDADYHRHLAERALRILQADFEPASWRAFWDHVVAGRSATEVATEHGLPLGAVYAAKFRILRRLRAELAGLWD